MQRIALFVLILYVVWRILSAWGRKAASEGRGAEDFSRFSARSRDRRKNPTSVHHQGGSELIECRRCGTLVPADRVLCRGNDVFCSTECRDRAE